MSFALVAVTLIATASAFNAQYNLNDHKGLCGKFGTISTNNAKTLKTFNKASAEAAADAICSAVTPALFGVPATCDTYSASNNREVVDITLTTSSGKFTCKFIVQNVKECWAANPSTSSQADSRGKTHNHNDDDDDDNGHRWFNKKRQAVFDPPACNTRPSRAQCLQMCTPTQDLLSDCDCIWDTPTNPAGQPTDQDSCPANSTCCFNAPCGTWDDAATCNTASGGDANGVGARCEFNAAAPFGQRCACKAPLVMVPLPPPNTDTYAPFDCVCQAEGYANTTEIALCPATGNPNGNPPTAIELKLILKFNFQVALIVSKVNVKTFVSQCALDRVSFQAPIASLKGLIDKVAAALKASSIMFKLQYFSDRTGAYLYTLQGYGGRLRSIAEEHLSPEDVVTVVEDSPIVDASSSAATASLAAAATAVVVATRLF